jgi:glycerophosphoryl diester phosphodiesterase
VIAWTVNSASEARRLAGYGIDGICTDDVTLLDSL